MEPTPTTTTTNVPTAAAGTGVASPVGGASPAPGAGAPAAARPSDLPQPSSPAPSSSPSHPPHTPGSSARSYVIPVLLTVAMLVAFSFGLLLFANTARQDLTDEFRAHLRDAAAVAALQVDPVMHQRVVESQDPGNTSEYHNLVLTLQHIKATNPEFLFVYTMIPSPVKGHTIIFIDAETDPAERSAPGDDYDAGDYPELFAGFEHPSADTEFACDDFGACMSGYAPIRTANGTSIGLLGLDTSAGTIQKHIGRVNESFVLTFTLVAVLTSLVGACLIVYVRRQQVADEQRVLAEAQLRHSFEEILSLSRHLNTQAEKVKRGAFETLDVEVRSDVAEVQELIKSFRFLVASVRMLAPSDEHEQAKG